LTDKAKEIEDIIIAIVNNISVDDKRLFSRDDKLELLRGVGTESGSYKCAGCGRYFLDDELTVDHKEPWSKGGRTVLSNAQLLCRACNSKKGNRQ
jgi:5-methylcytosine-specific restriction endonuclease McrA